MAAIIERVPWLDDRVSIKRFTKELEDVGGTESIYAALSRESGTKMGMAPSVVIYDELGQSEGRDLLDALDTAMGKRAEPLMIIISTQAARDEAPLSQLIDYGLRIHRGEIADPSFHLTLYTAPAEADPWIRSTWKLANPALGDFRSLEDTKRLALQAQRMPGAEASFRNLILNQRVDATAQFLSMATWKACGKQPCNTDLEGRPCYAGLDLGATRDMTALVLVFPGDDGAFDVVPYCWLPGETLQEREDRRCGARRPIRARRTSTGIRRSQAPSRATDNQRLPHRPQPPHATQPRARRLRLPSVNMEPRTRIGAPVPSIHRPAPEAAPLSLVQRGSLRSRAGHPPDRLPTSSATSSAPRPSIATPTGRP